MINKEYALYVPIKGETVKPVGNVVQNDIGANKFTVMLTDGKNPVDITGYTNVTFSVLKPDGTYCVDSLGDRIVVVDALVGKISIALHNDAINVPGGCYATLEVFSGTIRLSSSRMSFMVTGDLTVGSNPTAASSYPVLLQLLTDVSTLESNVEAAEGLRVTAEGVRSSAEGARNVAEGVRNINEAARISDEDLRDAAEVLRSGDEITRQSNEVGRVNAEGVRDASEVLRIAAEGGRDSAYTLAEAARNAESNAVIQAISAWEEYSSTKLYAPLNKVAYQGSSYINKVGCQGVLPTDTSKWTLIAAKGSDGEGAGDMLAYVYDPGNKSADAFDMSNMVEGVTNKIFMSSERAKLSGLLAGTTADINYYVATTGSDSANGSVGTPFATVQHAIDMLPKNVNHFCTVNIANGVYAETDVTVSGFNGTGAVIIQGNLITPANVTIGNMIVELNVCVAVVNGITFNNALVTNSLEALNCRMVNLTSLRFAESVTGSHILINESMASISGCVISNGDVGISADNNSDVIMSGCSGSGNGTGILVENGSIVTLTDASSILGIVDNVSYLTGGRLVEANGVDLKTTDLIANVPVISSAADISIADTGGKFSATNVEDALAETATLVSNKAPLASPALTAPTIDGYTPYTFGNITLATTAPVSVLADGAQVQVY